MGNTPAIRVRGLGYRYDPLEPALEGIDLTLPEDGYLAIVGQNGSGKTTLIKHFNGLLRPVAGSVHVYGVDTASATVGTLSRLVGYAFQNPDHGIFCSTVQEELAFGPRNLGWPAAEITSSVQETLQDFGLQGLAGAAPALLSYGLRRLVSIAAVVAMRPRLLVLDEPTAGLDACTIDELMALIDGLHAAGHAIVLVSHDLQLVAEHCRQVLVMLHGRALAVGAPEEILTDGKLLADAGLDMPSVPALAVRLRDTGLPARLLSVEAFADAYGDLLSQSRVPVS
ncbi:MAG: energy-coupling factor ABC transporter ATP-binding protein [Anaerolineae bacterium]|jgi:energy-coupling factor transporter ATP-binding protein EcfA2|nr:ATP-binding cassette domain-containing protein [Chloroflexota bacterium]